MSTPEYKFAIKNLQHSVALHLQIVGQATIDVAIITLNLLDIMDGDEQEAIEKMDLLSTWLVKRLLDIVIFQARKDKRDIRHIDSRYHLITSKQELLCLLANCLRAMDTVGNPVEIYDVNGVLL